MDIKLKATQWFKAGDHPAVEAGSLRVRRRGNAAYITGIYPFMNAWVEWEKRTVKPDMPDRSGFGPDLATFWDEVDGVKVESYRLVWLFSMWKFSRPEIDEPITEDHEFYRDCRMVEESLHGCVDGRGRLASWGLCGTLTGNVASSGRNVVPGSWIVEMPDGALSIVGQREFEERFGKQGA